MPSITVEDYIKQLYLATYHTDECSNADPEYLVPMGEIASRMNVQAGTVTSMMKTLVESGLAEYEPRQGARLTKSGNKLALHILRSHRLIELFLHRVLGYDWSEVHEDAEKLEHVVSEKFLTKIDELLGYPDTDPHGDPIPKKNGSLKNIKNEKKPIPINKLEANKTYILQRVLKQDKDFLNLLSKHKITPGEKITCLENNQDSGVIKLLNKKSTELSLSSSLVENLEFFI